MARFAIGLALDPDFDVDVAQVCLLEVWSDVGGGVLLLAADSVERFAPPSAARSLAAALLRTVARQIVDGDGSGADRDDDRRHGPGPALRGGSDVTIAASHGHRAVTRRRPDAWS